MPLTVNIVTAERNIFAESGVDKVIAPSTMGQITLLPRHAALITGLDAGELVVVKGQEEISVVVTGGFLEIKDDQVSVLADAAERAEAIDVLRAEEARRRAEERLTTRTSAVDLARAEAALRRSLIRLRVADRQRRRGGTRPGTPPRVNS